VTVHEVARTGGKEGAEGLQAGALEHRAEFGLDFQCRHFTQPFSRFCEKGTVPFALPEKGTAPVSIKPETGAAPFSSPC
jgi:hypothetical protein